MQSKAKLGAIVGDALVRVENLLELRLIALVPRKAVTASTPSALRLDPDKVQGQLDSQ